MVKHEFIKAKMRYQSRENDPDATIWGNFQAHTSPDCPNVNVTSRAEPYWFWKSEDSKWSLSPDWEESGQTVKTAVERFKAGPESTQKEVKRFEFVTFHQSYSYEEFVEGIRPVLDQDEADSTEVGYTLEMGVFRRICERARRDPENRYALFI